MDVYTYYGRNLEELSREELIEALKTMARTHDRMYKEMRDTHNFYSVLLDKDKRPVYRIPVPGEFL